MIPAAVCHYFTSNNFYKPMQQGLWDELRGRSESCFEDPEKRVQRIKQLYEDALPNIEHATMTWALRKRRVVTRFLRATGS